MEARWERERERENWNSEKWAGGAAAFLEALFYNPIYASYKLFIWEVEIFEKKSLHWRG